MKQRKLILHRMTAMVLTLVCVLGLFPATALAAAPDTIKLERFGMSGVAYQSASLGKCTLHQMYYDANGTSVVGSAPLPEEPDSPVAGDADITLKKVAAGTTRGLDGAKFNIYLNGQIVGSDVTQNGGIIEVNDVTEGLWSF